MKYGSMKHIYICVSVLGCCVGWVSYCGLWLKRQQHKKYFETHQSKDAVYFDIGQESYQRISVADSFCKSVIPVVIVLIPRILFYCFPSCEKLVCHMLLGILGAQEHGNEPIKVKLIRLLLYSIVKRCLYASLFIHLSNSLLLVKNECKY